MRLLKLFQLILLLFTPPTHTQLVMALEYGGMSRLEKLLHMPWSSSWREDQLGREVTVERLVVDLCGRELTNTGCSLFPPKLCTIRNGALQLQKHSNVSHDAVCVCGGVWGEGGIEGNQLMAFR